MEYETLSQEQDLAVPETRISVNGWILFAFICALSFGLTFLIREFIITEKLYYNTYAEQLSADRIRNVMAMQEKYAWFGYVLKPVFIALRVAYTALCLSVGAILAEYSRMNFRRLFKGALLCEGVYLLQSASLLIWNTIIASPDTLREVGTSLPVAVASLFDTSGFPTWALYALQSLNLFLLLYFVALAGMLVQMFDIDWKKAAVLSVASYGTGFLLWTVAVTFFLVQVA